MNVKNDTIAIIGSLLGFSAILATIMVAQYTWLRDDIKAVQEETSNLRERMAAVEVRLDGINQVIVANSLPARILENLGVASELQGAAVVEEAPAPSTSDQPG